MGRDIAAGEMMRGCTRFCIVAADLAEYQSFDPILYRVTPFDLLHWVVLSLSLAAVDMSPLRFPEFPESSSQDHRQRQTCRGYQSPGVQSFGVLNWLQWWQDWVGLSI